MLRVWVVAVFGSLLLGSPSALAHQNHQRYHRAIIDPLETHHAIIEDEFTWNFRHEEDPEDGESAQQYELELAWAFADLFGVEVFVPVVHFDPRETTAASGIGDIELDIKLWSFVHPSSKFVVTPQANLILPTGERDRNFGKSSTVLEPALLADLVLGEHVALQANLEYGVSLDKDRRANDLGYAVSLAYSFFLGPQGSFSPLLELVGETIASGPKRGENAVTLLPGFKWSWGGWHAGVGYQFPLTNRREFEWALLSQVGYHLSW